MSAGIDRGQLIVGYGAREDYVWHLAGPWRDRTDQDERHRPLGPGQGGDPFTRIRRLEATHPQQVLLGQAELLPRRRHLGDRPRVERRRRRLGDHRDALDRDLERLDRVVGDGRRWNDHAHRPLDR